MADDARLDGTFDAPGSGRGANERDEADAILRKLIGMDPAAFLNLVGLPSSGPIKLIESGIFPHILPIDRVLRMPSPKPWIAVIGLATSHDPGLVGTIETTLVSLLRYGLPMQPMIVLVRPEADDPSITGEDIRRMPWGEVVSQFNYDVIRVWQQPADRPLGEPRHPTLAGLEGSGLPELIADLRDGAVANPEDSATESVTCLVFALPKQGRVDRKVLADVAELERLAPCVYLGLDKRRDPQIVSRDEGCTVMRWKLYQRGARRFGPPDEQVASAIGAITSPRRLTDLDHFVARIDSQDYPITNWNELLAWREPADEDDDSETSCSSTS